MTQKLFHVYYGDVITRSTNNDEGIITVGLVSDKIDTYNTWINPEGMDSPVELAVVDFRHTRINTGAFLQNKRLQVINGVKTLVADIIVPKSAMLRIKGRNGETVEDGNAYDAVKSGRIMGVSIEFDPDPYPEHTRTDRNGRIYYEKWRLSRVTLLDQPPSQDSAFILAKKNFRVSGLDNDAENDLTQDMTFSKHDMVDASKGDSRCLARVIDTNQNGSYALRDEAGTDFESSDVREASPEQMRSYIQGVHKREDEAAQPADVESENEAEEKTESAEVEQKENEQEDEANKKNAAPATRAVGEFVKKEGIVYRIENIDSDVATLRSLEGEAVTSGNGEKLDDVTVSDALHAMQMVMQTGETRSAETFQTRIAELETALTAKLANPALIPVEPLTAQTRESKSESLVDLSPKKEQLSPTELAKAALLRKTF